MYPNSILNLIESLKLFPGIGEKTAERLAFSVLEMEDENVDFFAENLKCVKEKIHHCPRCNSITEEEICNICSNDGRENVLCVVEDPKSVFLFEKMHVFINPEDVGLEKLLERIKNEKFKEIIFAFKPSIEGETTSLYIKKILSDTDIKISQLASGLPMGADMEYVDSLTLERALSDRKELL